MNIRANAGALTQGVSTDTIDGFSIERAEKLAKTLRSREYVAKPVRRVQIPKKDGKTRPLGIPGGDDKLAQEVARIILERVYEPVFSEHFMDSDQNVRVKLRSDSFVQSGTELNGSWMLISKVSLTISPQTIAEYTGREKWDKNFLKLIEQWLKAGYGQLEIPSLIFWHATRWDNFSTGKYIPRQTGPFCRTELNSCIYKRYKNEERIQI
ncbi:hypothetical protein [Escherichia coli]|uniref:hypothetical protein n=1 Tax=Escherichia coli TaxID=562 RepID=UPI001FEDF6F0|nr:hypothetical protein [Escherichia coli]UPG28450.1 hypothetical protein J4V62_000260 [Escherichia coli]